jgi:predicted HAD superfamily hydrolase|tara:strand:+ start:163 stop:339 length:177 start_codon:yes stop_codon:yes gene_type:complete
MDELLQENKIRKSLAVDLKTYTMLQDICGLERRSKIDQLKILIEQEHERLNIERAVEA